MPPSYVGDRTGAPLATDFFAPPIPRLIAHRGASGTHPENTLAAFTAALAAGAEMIELDLHLSADRVPVVIHDPTLRRTTGREGRVAGCTAADLALADAGHGFSPDGGRSRPYRGRGLGVPALADVLAALPAARFTLEVKSLDPALDPALREVLERTGAARRVLLGSLEGETVRRLRRSFPEVPSSFARDEVAAFLRRGWAAAPPGAHALQVPPRHGLVRIVTRRLVEEAHRSGLEVHVWTVNDPRRMHALLDLSVDGIMTDFPGRLLTVYRERGVR